MKRINSKRPTLWYQKGKDQVGSPIYGPRLRVIYPNGKSEWILFHNIPNYPEMCMEWDEPCWNKTLSGLSKAGDGREAINLMNKYDEVEGFDKAEFVGYL